MSFFDKIGKTITTTSKDVAKKTKDLTETAKLNSQISSEQKTIDEIKNKIGHIYYSQYKNTPLDNLMPLCNEIDEAYKRIEAYRLQITQIKGVIACHNCGNELPDESLFCSKCGAKIEKPIIEDQEIEEIIENTLKCPNCNSDVSEDMAFCTECGNKLE